MAQRRARPVMSPTTRLATICAAFALTESRYLVVGTAACSLHGHIRPGLDVDILLKRNLENAVRVMAALETVGYPTARDWLPEDLLVHPVTVVGTNPAVTLFTSLGGLRYDEAMTRARMVDLDGTIVPVLGLDDLIASKRTGRPADSADLLALETLRLMGGTVD